MPLAHSHECSISLFWSRQKQELVPSVLMVFWGCQDTEQAEIFSRIDAHDWRTLACPLELDGAGGS